MTGKELLSQSVEHGAEVGVRRQPQVNMHVSE